MSEPQGTSVTSAIVVDTPIDRAFTVFTEEMGTWWPPEHHILEAELAEMVFEPYAGGHIYDRGSDGSECRWARVLAYEPPTRIVFTWNVSPQWTLESDPAKVSEVEVTFRPEGELRTHVELVHRDLDRHGDGWEQVRGAVGSGGGWPMGLERFRTRAEASQVSSPS